MASRPVGKVIGVGERGGGGVSQACKALQIARILTMLAAMTSDNCIALQKPTS